MAALHRDVKPTDVDVAIFGLAVLCVCVLLGCARCFKRKAAENPIEHSKLTEEHENLLTEITRLETCLQATKDEKNRLSSENEELTKKLESLKTEKEKLSKECENLLAETKQLETCLQATKDEKNRLSSENEELTTKLKLFNVLEEERDSFAKENMTLNNNYSKLHHTWTSLQATHENLTRGFGTLQTENEKISEEVKILRTNEKKLNDNLVEANRNLQEERSTLKKVQQEADSTQKKMTLELKKESAKLKEVDTTLQQILKARLCVMCINNEKLVSVSIALSNVMASQQISSEFHIIPKRLTGVLSISEGDFCKANMIVLVGIAEPRNMLISDKEPSQLGVVYREAQKLNKHIFMIYVDDKYSDSLKDSQAYHPSLKTMLENQKSIGELAENNRFLSIKIKDKTSIHKFNGTQSMQISKWIATAFAS